MSCRICGESGFKERAKLEKCTYVECNNCHVVYQKELPSMEAVNNIYDTNDGGYFQDDYKGVDYSEGEEWIRGSAVFQISILKKHYSDDLSKATILDFGAGTGVLLHELKKLGAGVEGIELSKWACEYGEKKFGVKMHNGDLFVLPISDNKFDIIIMSHVIEHLPDPVEIVLKLKNWLKPGGILMVATPNVESTGEHIFKSKWLYYIPNEHLQLFSPQSIDFFFKKIGLQNKGTELYLWRKRQTPEALLRLAYSFVKRGIKILTGAAKKEGRFEYGTSKDGLISFGVKSK
ncbi:MAG: class I SAM-dependent methyltransferase [Bacteroidota bacterium]